MSDHFSPMVSQALSLVWLQHDPKQIKEGQELLRQCSEEGDPEGMCFYARTLMGPSYAPAYAGLARDEGKAQELLRSSIKAGSGFALLLAMRCRFAGNDELVGMSPFASLKEGFDRVHQVALKGNPFAEYMIGNTFYYQDYLSINEDNIERKLSQDQIVTAFTQEACHWFELAVDHGLSSATPNLVKCYEALGTIDRVRAAFEAAARLGDPQFMSQLGNMIEGEDPVRAYSLYLKGSELEYPQAYYDVGYSLEHGRGVEVDHLEAVRYYAKGSDHGNYSSRLALTRKLFWGNGVAADFEGAYHYATLIYDDAQVNTSYDRLLAVLPMLCHIYLFGFGKVQKAEQWAKKRLNDLLKILSDPERSAMISKEDQGLIHRDIGLIYEYALGGEAEDVGKAVEHYRKAADLGDAEAKEQMTHFKKRLFGGWKRV